MSFSGRRLSILRPSDHSRKFSLGKDLSENGTHPSILLLVRFEKKIKKRKEKKLTRSLRKLQNNSLKPTANSEMPTLAIVPTLVSMPPVFLQVLSGVQSALQSMAMPMIRSLGPIWARVPPRPTTRSPAASPVPLPSPSLPLPENTARPLVSSRFVPLSPACTMSIIARARRASTPGKTSASFPVVEPV